MNRFGRTILAALVACTSPMAWPHDLGGKWSLKIENLDHAVVTSMSVRFTQKPARSCLGGSWLQLAVDSPVTTDPAFFPTDEPLSYRVEGAAVTIGRNEVCDAYLHLSGHLDALPIRGEYSGFGWGGGRLKGHFSLERMP